MNIAATLPRFLQVGSRARQAVSQNPACAAAATEWRSLSRDTIVTLDNRPLQLRVLRGWVWITRDGCQADMVLGAGDTFEQHPGAPVLVQALEDVELLIAKQGERAQDA